MPPLPLAIIVELTMVFASDAASLIPRQIAAAAAEEPRQDAGQPPLQHSRHEHATRRNEHTPSPRWHHHTIATSQTYHYRILRRQKYDVIIAAVTNNCRRRNTPPPPLRQRHAGRNKKCR